MEISCPLVLRKQSRIAQADMGDACCGTEGNGVLLYTVLDPSSTFVYGLQPVQWVVCGMSKGGGVRGACWKEDVEKFCEIKLREFRVR